MQGQKEEGEGKERRIHGGLNLKGSNPVRNEFHQLIKFFLSFGLKIGKLIPFEGGSRFLKRDKWEKNHMSGKNVSIGN